MKRLNVPSIAEDRQRMHMRMAESLSPDRSGQQIIMRLNRSEDLLLMVESFAYLSDRPKIRSLHVIYIGPPPATHLVPLTIGSGLHQTAVDEFELVSEYHVVRGIHGDFGRNLHTLTLHCNVNIAGTATVFPLLTSLDVAGTFRGNALSFPSLTRLTLTRLNFHQTAFPLLPTVLTALTYDTCVLSDNSNSIVVPASTSPRSCVLKRCTVDADALTALLHQFRATLEHVRLEDAQTPMEELVLDSALSKLSDLEIRRVDMDAVVFRASESDTFASLNIIVLERKPAEKDGKQFGDMAIYADPPGKDMERLEKLLANVTTMELRGHAFFFFPALKLPHLERYLGSYVLDPAGVLTKEMDMDDFLPLNDKDITPWHTYLLHMLRANNHSISLVSRRGRAFDIVRRRAPYFVKVVIAPTDAARFFREETCLLCKTPFSKAEHDAEPASAIENNRFLDHPYRLQEQWEHGCVVRCNDPHPDHDTHYMHRGCFSQRLFSSSPEYMDPYNIPLL